MLHEHENNQDTETFLKANGEKFQGDALAVMRLLFSGIRLSALTLVQNYQIHDRRLRDVIKARPDMVKKEWKLNSEGKRMYVEYFIEKFQPPTKEQLIQKFWDEYQEEQPTMIIPREQSLQLSLYETQFR